MSFYNFAPSPTLLQPYATWENGFDDSQIKKIIDIGESLDFQDGKIGSLNSLKENFDYRKSKISWISLTSDTSWLYESFAYIARNLNGQIFNFDITGFLDNFQYTVYTANNDHYNWHTDQINGVSTAPRKLSFVLQLSDPDEYEGGDLELLLSADPVKLKKQKGLVCAFPSWTLHRVTPVTKGIRKTLVVWVVGPKFR